jgi:hypothetical protein
LGAGTAAAPQTVTGPGHVNEGGVWSFTVIICVHSAKLPATSVALYVLVIVYLLVQLCALITSPCHVTVTPGQLSVAVTLPVFGAGTALAQLTVTGAGHVIDGVSVSFTVTVNEQLAVPQGLVAVIVTLVVPTLKNEPLPLPLPLPVVEPEKV